MSECAATSRRLHVKVNVSCVDECAIACESKACDQNGYNYMYRRTIRRKHQLKLVKTRYFKICDVGILRNQVNRKQGIIIIYYRPTLFSKLPRSMHAKCRILIL